MLQTCKSRNPDFCIRHSTSIIKQQLDYAKNLHRQAKGRTALLEAQKDIDRLTRIYNATPEGIRKLKEQIKSAKNEGTIYPLQLGEKLRIANLDYSKRKAEYFIEQFENITKKLQPEDILKLFKNTKYVLKNVSVTKKNYFELYDGSKEYTPNNVIATIKRTKGGYLVTTKASLNEPNILAQTVGSTDGNFGDIIAVKKTLVSLRREVEKKKSQYNHGKYILSDARKYGLLTLTKTILFNGIQQKHYIIYSTKGIPYAIYRVDNNGTFVEGHGALGRENTEFIDNAWNFREWVTNYQNTERRLPEDLVKQY